MKTPVKSLVVVLGASENPHRYAHQAAHQLIEIGYAVWLLGSRPGKISSQPITMDWPNQDVEIHTITVYLAPERLESQLEKICNLKPQRVILNPGTEHDGHAQRLKTAGIAVEEACTLVLLATGQF
jgi:predicted CoA-binding protein